MRRIGSETIFCRNSKTVQLTEACRQEGTLMVLEWFFLVAVIKWKYAKEEELETMGKVSGP
jgi:hypothetical protein